MEEEKKESLLSTIGPGLITGASDDDPSGIATYSQAGAQFGYSTLWTALITYPLMAAIQGMCARIGLVTCQGLAVTLRQHYSKPLLYIMLFVSFPAITLNIGADIQGMGAVANMLYPAIPTFVYSIVITALLMFVIIRFPYKKIALILKWLCLSLLLYLIVPFLLKQDVGAIIKNTFVPHIEFNKEFLSLLVALLGTTISPYLFFWQTTMEAENRPKEEVEVIVDKSALTNMRKDVNIGMLFSNLVMFFIILTAASTLNKAGIKEIDTVDQAAKALEPIAGKLAYGIFALGVLGTGMLAIPVLAGSQSYMLAETFGWQEGLDKKFVEAKGFYVSIIISLIVGMMLNFIGISPIKALLYTAIIYGITAPVLIAIILHVANNKKIMGKHTNSWLSNLLGGITLLLMTIAAVLLIWYLFH